MLKASHHPQSLRIFLVIVSVALLSSAAPARPEENPEPEVSASATALLKFLNTAPEKKLSETPGLNPQTIKKLLAHRASAGAFSSLAEFTETCEVQDSDFEKLLKPYRDEEVQRRLDASRKDIPDVNAKSREGRLQKNPGDAPAPDKAQTAGPIGMVRPGYYSKLPGYDELDKIDPLKRTEFLETVNREMCSCGCKNETVAFCLVNDPACPVVKARAKKIYDDIMTKAPR